MIVPALALVCVASMPVGDEAEGLFLAGRAAFEAGHHDAAAHALELSFELNARPEVAFWLADAYRILFFSKEDERHVDRAVALFRIYLDQTPSGGRRTDAIINLATLEPIKARLALERAAAPLVPEAPITFVRPTRLIVTSPVAGARVLVDERPAQVVPAVLEVTPGRHAIRVRAPGYAPRDRQVTTVDAKVTAVHIELDELPAQVSLQGDAGASVYLDGNYAGALPLSNPISMRPGRHQLWVSQKGREPWRRYVNVDRGDTVAVRAQLEMSLQRQIAVGAMTAGAVSWAAAGVMGILALRDNQEATLLRDRREVGELTATELPDYNRRVARAQSRSDAGWALFGAGAAVGLAGALLYVFDEPPAVASDIETEVAPEVSGEGVAIGLSGWVGADGSGIVAAGRF